MNYLKKLFVMLLVTTFISGCQPTTNHNNLFKEDTLKVVTSFSIIADLINEVGQDHVSVYNLVPTGTDPHDYEPLPKDNKAVSDADVLFYNGLNLEGGPSGWFFKLINSIKVDKQLVFEVSEGVDVKYLKAGERDEQINPHAFLDPQVGMIMVTNIQRILSEIDPDHAQEYQVNANAYLQQLQALDDQYKQRIATIPKEHRVFTASEHAFQYVTERYGLEHLYIWEIDTDELGTPEQIRHLVDQLKAKQPPVLFLESNVQSKPMQQVSKETNIPIHPRKVYADEIGKPQSEVDTYLKLLQHNLDVIVDGLTLGG